jgi:uncharacterized protein (DUF433 family)
MDEWQKRVTINPEQCGGRPCIRGLRIRVTDIIDLLASGLNQDQIVEELPDLEKEDFWLRSYIPDKSSDILLSWFDHLSASISSHCRQNGIQIVRF